MKLGLWEFFVQKHIHTPCEHRWISGFCLTPLKNLSATCNKSQQSVCVHRLHNTVILAWPIRQLYKRVRCYPLKWNEMWKWNEMHFENCPMMHTFANKIITFFNYFVQWVWRKHFWMLKEILMFVSTVQLRLDMVSLRRWVMPSLSYTFFWLVVKSCCYPVMGGTINAIRVESLVTCLYVKCKNFCVNYFIEPCLFEKHHQGKVRYPWCFADPMTWKWDCKGFPWLWSLKI